MLGIQNSMQAANPVKFGHDGSYSRYDLTAINQERDENIGKVNDFRDEFDSLADTLEANPDKFSKKAGKLARTVATLTGIAVTFLTAKYGSKATINALKGVAQSKGVKAIVDNVKNLAGPAKKVMATAGELIEKTGIKNTKVAQKTFEVLDKPLVKSVLKNAKGVFEQGVKSVKGFNYQAAAENIIGASATASVIIDDLAGRNDNKSSLKVAMGASGGDE